MSSRSGDRGYRTVAVSTRCFYCGAARAADLDHFIPVVWARSLPVSEDGKVKVPCCRNCNGLAGGMPFDTVGEKADWIAWRLRSKHKVEGPITVAPTIETDDLKGLGRTLKGEVAKRRAGKVEILRRIAHLELVAADQTAELVLT